MDIKKVMYTIVREGKLARLKVSLDQTFNYMEISSCIVATFYATLLATFV